MDIKVKCGMLLMDAGKVLVTDKVIRHIYDMNLQIV